MKKAVEIISFLTAWLFLLSSCQAIYEAPLELPKTTANSDTDQNDEYYTIGVPYFTGDMYEGMLYEGCLIYIEQSTTTGVVGEYTSADGIQKPKYGDVLIERIVKYNPATGTISSPCLNPTCNHSLESNCPMLLGYGTRSREMYTFKGIFGDWMVYMIKKSDDEYTVLNTEIMYNLKTGECRKIHEDDLGSVVLSRWTSGIYFDGKYYKISCVMDYSDTGYEPGQGMSVADFDPVTRRYLYEYDFEFDSSTELFEIGEDWSLAKVTNKRFYFCNSDKTFFSINKDGTGERKEVAINISNLVDTCSINYTQNGYIIHDLKTDEMKNVVFDYSIIGVVCVTEKGILSAHQTKYDEWDKFSSREYRKEHPYATSDEVNNAKKKILASGSAQIWQCGHLGEDNKMIFELPAARIEIISAYGDHVFAKVSRYDSDTGEYLEGFNNRTCCIDIKSGEITPIPQLDIVVPYWYVN